MVRENQELREKTQRENQAEVGDARPKGANISDRSKHQTWKLWLHAKNSHMKENEEEEEEMHITCLQFHAVLTFKNLNP